MVAKDMAVQAANVPVVDNIRRGVVFNRINTDISVLFNIVCSAFCAFPSYSRIFGFGKPNVGDRTYRQPFWINFDAVQQI